MTAPWIDFLPQLPSGHTPASLTSGSHPGKSFLSSWDSAGCVIPVCKVGITTAPISTGCCAGEAVTPQAKQRVRALQMAVFLLVQKVAFREEGGQE